MMAVETGRPQVRQLERAIERAVIGPRLAERHRERMLADGRDGEYEQQIHATVAGVAGNVPGFVDESFSFEYPFVYAPIQRRSDLRTPHFRSGVELTTANQYLVLVSVHVIGWATTEEGWIVGAKVRFAVQCPLATTQAIPYNAIAHLAFQGYASLPEGSEFS